MARLIDGDALIPEFDAWALVLNHMPKNNSGVYGRDEVMVCVKDAPTIDAIPVEWLRRYAPEKWSMYMQAATEIIIEAWQKEQEADHEREDHT